MLLEAALCLALQQKELDASPEVQKGGVLTPASGEERGWVCKIGCAGGRAVALSLCGSWEATASEDWSPRGHRCACRLSPCPSPSQPCAFRACFRSHGHAAGGAAAQGGHDVQDPGGGAAGGHVMSLLIESILRQAEQGGGPRPGWRAVDTSCRGACAWAPLLHTLSGVLCPLKTFPNACIAMWQLRARTACNCSRFHAVQCSLFLPPSAACGAKCRRQHPCSHPHQLLTLTVPSCNF